MPRAPVTVMGGLPLIADVWFTRGDGYSTDDDGGVDALYWCKRDGTAGKEISEAMYERISKRDEWWEAHVTEQASDWLAYSDHIEGTVEL